MGTGCRAQGIWGGNEMVVPRPERNEPSCFCRWVSDPSGGPGKRWMVNRERSETREIDPWVEDRTFQIKQGLVWVWVSWAGGRTIWVAPLEFEGLVLGVTGAISSSLLRIYQSTLRHESTNGEKLRHARRSCFTLDVKSGAFKVEKSRGM